MADTGIIRWPINFPPSSKAAILREARMGRITCQRVKVTPLTYFLLYHSVPFLSAVSHLFEDDRLLVPHWVDGVVVLGGFGLQRFPPGVRRKSEHLHLYIHTHPSLSQKLAWNHLRHTETWKQTDTHKWLLHRSHSRDSLYIIYKVMSIFLRDDLILTQAWNAPNKQKALIKGNHCTFTERVLATMPSTVFSAKGSKCLSGRLMNSGLSL